MLFFILIILLSINLNAQNLEIRNINTEGISIVAEIRLNISGQSQDLELNEVFVREDFYPNRINQISSLADKWYKISWIPNSDVFSENVTYDYESSVVATKNGISASNTVFVTDYSSSRVLLKYNIGGGVVGDITFPNTIAGGMNFQEVQLVGVGRMFGGQEQRVRIDSITIDNPAYQVVWKGGGNPLNMTPPPVSISPGSIYLMQIQFRPQVFQYYQALLTVHFDGGAKKRVSLFGNYFAINEETSLKLIYPRGGVSIAPCADLRIAWTGQNPAIPVRVDASFNGGNDWELITATRDSVIWWKVPDRPTNSLRIKVSQSFVPLSSPRLDTEQPMLKLGIGGNPTQVIFQENNRELLLWNWQTNTRTNLNINTNFINVFGMGADYDGADIVTSYSRGRDTIEVIKANDDRTKIPMSTIRNTDMVMHRDLNYAIFTPLEAAVSEIYNYETGQKVRDLFFVAPIVKTSVSEEARIVSYALQNGDILLYKLDDFSLINTLYYPHINILSEMSISPNGRFIGIASLFSGKGLTETRLIDVETGFIVYTLRSGSSNVKGIRFNQLSTMAVIGWEFGSSGGELFNLIDLTTRGISFLQLGNPGKLTSLAFSPTAPVFASIHENSFGRGINQAVTFSFPESDMSDSNNVIAYPIFAVDTLQFQQQIVDDYHENTFTVNFCNEGPSDLVSFGNRMQFGTHFQFIAIDRDTIKVGQCGTITMRFMPLDTGKLDDNLVFFTCNKEYSLPVSGIGQNRTFAFTQIPFNFGEICVNQTTLFELELFRNSDTSSVLINRVDFLQALPNVFRVVNAPENIRIDAGGVYSATISVTPEMVGLYEANVIVYHSNLGKLALQSPFQVIGLGSDVEFSHEVLPFIPEELTRTLTIKSNNITPVAIESIDLTGKPFELISTLPIILNTGQQTELELRWNGEDFEEFDIIIDSDPCPLPYKVKIVKYSSTALIKAKDVKADPRNSAQIVIELEQNENYSYKGVRKFETELTLYPYIFFPEKINSQFGEAQLTSRVENGQRIINLSIIGDFPKKGDILTLDGVAGLTDVISSPISFDANTYGFGTFVTTNYQSGKFELDSLCEDRRVTLTNQPIITSISPNPATVLLNINFDLSESSQLNISVDDLLGKPMITSQYSAQNGANSVNLDIQSLPKGIYLLKIGNGISVATHRFVVTQ